MPGSDAQARRRLGAALDRRRFDMDARYRNRELFVRERNAELFPGGPPGISSRTVYDIERAKRANFDTTTKSTIELVYALRRGAIDRALAAGGEIADGDALPFAAPSLTAAGTVQDLQRLVNPGRDLDEIEDAIDSIEDSRARTEFRQSWRTELRPALERIQRERAGLEEPGAADGAGA